MSPIRILHIVGKMDRAGAETMLMNLYRHIDRDQIQFDFITFTEETGDYDEEILALGGKIFPIVSKNPIQRMFMLRLFLQEHQQYKIIHAHMLLNNAFHILAARIAGVKHIISHAHSTNNGKIGLLAKSYEIFSKYINKNLATHQIACGKEAAEYLFGSKKDVWLLNNSINLNTYTKIAGLHKTYWQEIEPNIKGLKIIQVGRLNEVKNHDFSLDIMRNLKKKGFEFSFFIVGQGPLQQIIHEKIQTYGLENNVKILGLRSDVPQLMAGADVMLMPSLHEGFPVVLVESQAIGLLSILSESISKEVDLNLDLIEFLPLSNIERWVDSLIQYKPKNVCHKHIYQRMSSHGFDVQKNAFDLLHFYQDLNHLEK